MSPTNTTVLPIHVLTDVRQEVRGVLALQLLDDPKGVGPQEDALGVQLLLPYCSFCSSFATRNLEPREADQIRVLSP